MTEGFVAENSFAGIYSKATANMWLVRPRVYVWATGMFTVIRMITKILFLAFAVNFAISPKGGCFSRKVEGGRFIK